MEQLGQFFALWALMVQGAVVIWLGPRGLAYIDNLLIDNKMSKGPWAPTIIRAASYLMSWVLGIAASFGMSWLPWHLEKWAPTVFAVWWAGQEVWRVVMDKDWDTSDKDNPIAFDYKLRWLHFGRVCAGIVLTLIGAGLAQVPDTLLWGGTNCFGALWAIGRIVLGLSLAAFACTPHRLEDVTDDKAQPWVKRVIILGLAAAGLALGAWGALDLPEVLFGFKPPALKF